MRPLLRRNTERNSTLVIVAVALGAAYYRWSRRRLYRLAREIPSGLKDYPIVGHAYKFLGSSEDRINAFQAFGRVANLQGGLSSFWLGHRLYICVTDPKAIEVVTKTCLHKDEYTIKLIRTVIGNGSIFAPVNIWQPRRRIMAPFFNLKNLNQLVRVFQDKSSIMADLMGAEVGGGDFPLWKYMTTYTFDTAFETALGRRMNYQEASSHFALRALHAGTHMLAERVLQPWLHPDFIYKRLPVYKRFRTQLQRCWDLIDEIIQEKRTELKAAESKSIKDKGRTSFLDTIIQSSGEETKGYSNLELREEVMVIWIAGSDSSAVGACFTAVMLSRHPGVQDRVYQELREVFGDSDREVTAQDLPKLKYLEAVIKESLRLYPPVPVVTRELHNDVVLPSGVKLVSGTSIMINIWGTHRNTTYWGADSDLFRPERFLEGPLRHPAMFIPFSYSVRNCIGGTYAMLSMKTALANLLRRYKLLPPINMAAADLTKPLRVKFALTIKTVDDFIVRVERRN